MINKENSNQVRILIVIEVIRFTKLINGPNKNNLFLVG